MGDALLDERGDSGDLSPLRRVGKSVPPFGSESVLLVEEVGDDLELPDQSGGFAFKAFLGLPGGACD
ncbi:hypothetical protein O1R50_09005 [Glycomyces luteolus]|uniref:Uncharacterized protein n=1 Tax=Glycomyces luteolus TaxID=2670330 RepID=A0A9X3SRB2_9ACTN|nr:hypothetical protein [Glycomyces luteolus]MDA1359759.1 hypothetical protein [Glycomyces luteolus]